MDILSHPLFVLALLALVVILFIGMYTIAWARDWRQRLREVEPPAEDEQERFHRLYEAGELSQEEYEQICRALGKTNKPVSDEEKGS